MVLQVGAEPEEVEDPHAGWVRCPNLSSLNVVWALCPDTVSLEFEYQWLPVSMRMFPRLVEQTPLPGVGFVTGWWGVPMDTAPEEGGDVCHPVFLDEPPLHVPPWGAPWSWAPGTTARRRRRPRP